MNNLLDSVEYKSCENEKPTRCIDAVMKFCQECKYGHIIYPAWVETKEDLADCCFETACIYGFDKGRPEDEPTDEELKEFDEMVKRSRSKEYNNITSNGIRPPDWM